MNRREILKIMGTGLAALSSPRAFAAAPESAKRPNILYIMADDHAAHAIGAYGGRLAALNPTPNIDRLAREGVRLTNAFCANSICVPSRATILTGQHSHVNGCRTLDESLPRERQTLPQLMKQAGYETALIGKWHLVEEPNFDYYNVLPGQGSYFNPVLIESGGVWPKNEKRYAAYDSQHSSNVVTNLSLAWLKKRAKGKPFFLMHQFKDPHDNFENAQRYDWLFEGETLPEPESLWERGNHGPVGRPLHGTSISGRNARRNMGQHMFVDPALEGEAYTRVAYQRYIKKYLRCVHGLDDNVGRLLEFLEQTGELDNTIILYTSDQGMMLGEHDYIDKRWMYEESMRMPFIVRYPRWVRAGAVSDALVCNVDFAPTILDMAGAKAPDSMQGRSFLPILRGEPAPADWRKSLYYRYWMHMVHHDVPAHYGVRTRDHKLIFFYGLPVEAGKQRLPATEPYWELYDLRKDPQEMNNVYGKPEYAQVTRELKAELLRLKEQIGDDDSKYPALMEIRKKYWD